MHTPSFWENESFLDHQDFLVAGAGIVGLSTAIQLKKRFPDCTVTVVERAWIPAGASTRNAGFACFGSPTELLDDLLRSPEDEVFRLVEKRWTGLQLLRETIGDQNMEYLPLGGFEVFTHGQENIYHNTLTRLPELNQAIREYLPQHPVFQEVPLQPWAAGMKNLAGIIRIEGEAQIHTGKMMKALWNLALNLGVRIYTGVTVTAWEDEQDRVKVHINDHYTLTASRLFLTLNGFIRDLLPALDVKPARAQVMITRPIQGLQLSGNYHYDAGYYYFRNVGDRLLIGGGRNLDFSGEETTQMENTEPIMNALHHLLQTVILPGIPYEEEMRWSGIMGVGSEKQYILKRISPAVTIGVRMGGMGVALGSLIGKELAESV